MQKKLSLIIILLSSIYFISQFSRASLGVVVIDIAADLNLNSEQIGRLGGVFFLSFALTQVPLGIMLDAFNPVKIIIYMMIIVFSGSFLFGIADNYSLLILARILSYSLLPVNIAKIYMRFFSNSETPAKNKIIIPNGINDLIIHL